MNGTGLCASRLKRTAPQWQEPSRCMVSLGSWSGFEMIACSQLRTPMDMIHRIHRRRQHGQRHHRRPGPGPAGRGDPSSSSIRSTQRASGWPRSSACARRPRPTPSLRRRRAGGLGRQAAGVLAGCGAGARRTARGALHLSVMAGIRSDAIARAIGTERVVRSMPNTPALIGQGIAGLFARAGRDGADRARSSRCSRRPASRVGRRARTTSTP